MVPPAVVIPVSPGHEENLKQTLRSVNRQSLRPAAVVVVAHRYGLAGQEAIKADMRDLLAVPWTLAVAHDDQAPRTVGANVVARDLRQYGVGRVAFLDADIDVQHAWLATLNSWMGKSGADVIAGPYDFMAPGETRFDAPSRNDTRWPLFTLSRTMYDSSPDGSLPLWAGDITRGLALYGGNLLWDLDRFLDLGGFLPLVRGEDGELGIRAARRGVKMGFAWDARGWHQWHRVDLNKIYELNRHDIPKIWGIHGDYLRQHGVSMVQGDGCRLNIRDTDGWEGNTALLWQREMERPEGVEWVRP